ncbi:intermembrane transport protein PqiB [Photobacterium halotolerans]|uniref:intermembrane transport protein PqiB n=1 Tax=Photobacterium halotolerans TaxID=265726 RepID=UPI001373488C|nr:intermembrane transport protein PqiB [Photobacterium halotolerans]NAW88818.1 intermembrane transport protein PqiB [Photobacterium halotolerans]NAX46982.1 intermembrane transport protein PqiB [Photobacterium halotolerans]
MSDQTPPKAEVSQIRQLSLIWLVPIVAVLIGFWMLIQFVASKGPEVTLKLNTAEGLEVGKTEIKALNVKVGVITNVKLSDDYNSILAIAQMDKDAERMLRTDTRFWVVKPRIGKEGISGLETLLSGAYIELQPGVRNDEQRTFTVLDIPPVAPLDAKGLRLILTHNEAGKLSVGDPVLYEGFTVGRVEQVSFDTQSKKANYQLFIFEPYDGLIRKRTRFWLTSGVELNMSAEGFNLKIGSVESLITGGVSFNIQQGAEPGELITKQLSRFRLYNNQNEVRERFYDQYLEYVLLFDESVRGLSEGAPVEYRGIRIGTVSRVPLRLPNQTRGFSNQQIPVLVRLELARVQEYVGTENLQTLQEDLSQQFREGLRASLKTANFLTGQLMVDVEFYPEEPDPTLLTYREYDVFPTKAGGFAEIQKQVASLLDKLNNLPVESTLKGLNQTLTATERTLKAAEQAAKSVNVLLAQQDTKAIPAELRNSLAQIQATLNSYGSDGATYRNLEQVLIRFEQVMKELQPVLRQVNDKPNSLIFSDSKGKDPIPAAGVQ